MPQDGFLSAPVFLKDLLKAMLAARTLDPDAVVATLAAMLAPEDPRWARLAEAERLADA